MLTLNYSVDFSGWYGPMNRCAARARNPVPALDDVGEFMVGVTRRNLDDEGGAQKFVPLAESTLINRARYPHGRGEGRSAQPLFYKRRKTNEGERAVRMRAAVRILNAKPLIWTKKLYRDLRYVTGQAYVDVGSTFKYSWALFLGYAPSHLPARYPWVRTDADNETIVSLFVRHLLGPLGIH